jgi:hypothetical protein
MPKKIIAVIIVSAIGFSMAVIFFMKESAEKAQKESGRIVEGFKTIDKNLQQSAIAIDSANGILTDSLAGKLNSK